MIKKASIVGFVLGLLLIFAPSISKAAVTPANLPFSFNGKLADLKASSCFTYSGLGSDYAGDLCCLKFDSAGDWVMLQLAEDPGCVSFMLQAHNCNTGNKFDIQYSIDGSNFVTFHTCSNLYTTIDTVSVDLSLISGIRYIRWTYTTKNTGNYGLGAIKISKRGDVFTYIVDSDTAVIGSEHVFPKLINSYNKAVTYSSSAPDIATVDEAGNITLVAPGTTTITAQTTTDDGQKLSASYLLVVRKPTNTITFDSPAGTYVAAPVSVSLSASADGTTFYYTTDGSDPTTESPLYTEAIEVTHSGTELKVLALNNETEDAMVSASYVIQPEKPLFDKEAQRFVKTLDVGLSLPESTPSTSKIYYAINEQADATKTLYEGTPVTLAGSSASQKIALHAVVVDEFGNVGVENSVEYTYETAVYKKVTSQEEIVDGGEYLVVCEDYNVAMSDYNSSTHFMDQYGIIIDKTNNTIITSKDLAVTLVKRSSGYGIRYDATNYIAWQTKQSKDTYFYKSSSSVSTDGNTQWTISVLPDGNVEVEDLGSSNGTFIDGVRIIKKVVSRNTTIQMGSRYTFKVSDVFPETPKASAPQQQSAPTQPKPVPEYSIKHLKYVWDEYEETIAAIRQKSQQMGKKRMIPMMLGSFSGLISAFVGSGAFITIPIAIVSFIFLFKAYNEKDTSLEDTKAAKDTLINKYVCPNPECHRSLPHQDYSLLSQNTNCPYCKCKWTTK